MRELKDVDLVDGLDISTGQYRAHTSFIRKMEQLLNFDGIRFSCAFRNGSTNYWHEFKNNGFNSDVLKYFTGNSDVRPAEGLMSLGTNQKDYIVDAVDEMISSESINFEERTYKDILLNKDGLHLTFGNSSKHCFNKEDDFVRFEVFVE